MHEKRKSSSGVIIGLLVTLLFTGVIIFLAIKLGSLSSIGDIIAGLGYTPSSEMADIIERDDFTESGLRILRATHPELEEADDFNQHCYSGAEKESSVLGCYSADRIYVYDINNEELDGIKETVLAHELLHAVWNRMSRKDRSALYEDLDSTYKNHKKEFGDHMSLYSSDEYYDELHSIIGSQLAGSELTETLRAHYAKYFVNQNEIANFYNAYSAKFEALEKKASTLESQIKSNKEKIERLTNSYNYNYDSLVSDIESFNARANQPNGFSSRSQFDAERNQLISRQKKLESDYRTLNNLINSTNAKVEEYNNNVVQIGKLYDSVNSHVAQPDSMIEE